MSFLSVNNRVNNSRRFYTVVAPKVVRPNSEYHVAVSTTGISTPSTIVVELDGDLDTGKVFGVSAEGVVEPYSTRIFKLEVKKKKNLTINYLTIFYIYFS